MSNPKDTYAETRGWKSILKRQFFKRTIFCRWVMNLALFYFLTTVFFFYPGEAKGLAAILMYNTRLSGCGSWDLAGD